MATLKTSRTANPLDATSFGATKMNEDALEAAVMALDSLRTKCGKHTRWPTAESVVDTVLAAYLAAQEHDYAELVGNAKDFAEPCEDKVDVLLLDMADAIEVLVAKNRTLAIDIIAAREAGADQLERAKAAEARAEAAENRVNGLLDSINKQEGF